MTLNKSNQSISITIPAYNEETTLLAVCREAISSVTEITNDYEIVLVDDGSSDKTGTIMEELKKKNPDKIVVIHHKKNRGFSGAMKSCFRYATKSLIFLGPADGQFDYNQLRLFVSAIKNYDIVTEYRPYNEEPWYRKFNSFIYHSTIRLLLGIRLRELSSCIMYRREVRNSITISADDFSCLFLSEFVYKSMKKRYSIGQVPIRFYRRRGGVSKGANPKMIMRTIREIIRFWLETR